MRRLLEMVMLLLVVVVVLWWQRRGAVPTVCELAPQLRSNGLQVLPLVWRELAVLQCVFGVAQCTQRLSHPRALAPIVAGGRVVGVGVMMVVVVGWVAGPVATMWWRAAWMAIRWCCWSLGIRRCMWVRVARVACICKLLLLLLLLLLLCVGRAVWSTWLLLPLCARIPRCRRCTRSRVWRWSRRRRRGSTGFELMVATQRAIWP